jgi:hypothetical protein
MAVRVVIIPRGTILQEEIEEVLSIENAITKLKQQRDVLVQSLLSRLEAGATVEPGLYELTITERCAGGKRCVALRIL